MRFVEGSAGLGFGIKKYDLIFVFQNEKALADFATKGWQAGGQGTLAAKGRAGGKAVDGAASIYRASGFTRTPTRDWPPS